MKAKPSKSEEILCVNRGDLCARCAAKAEKRAVETPVVTPTQMEILKYVVTFDSTYGFPPSLDEIAANSCIGKVTAWEHVGNLIEKGYVRKERHKSRSIRVREWVASWVRKQIKNSAAMACA